MSETASREDCDVDGRTSQQTSDRSDPFAVFWDKLLHRLEAERRLKTKTLFESPKNPELHVVREQKLTES